MNILIKFLGFEKDVIAIKSIYNYNRTEKHKLAEVLNVFDEILIVFMAIDS